MGGIEGANKPLIIKYCILFGNDARTVYYSIHIKNQPILNFPDRAVFGTVRKS